MRRSDFAPGQDHLLDAVPQAEGPTRKAPAARTPAAARATPEARADAATSDNEDLEINAQRVDALRKLRETLENGAGMADLRDPLKSCGFLCGPVDARGYAFDVKPPPDLPSIDDVIGDMTSRGSMNSRPQLVAYVEGVLKRVSGRQKPTRRRGAGTRRPRADKDPAPESVQKKARRPAPAPAPAMDRGPGRGPPWLSEEEEKLRELVAELGDADRKNWPTIAERLGTGRTANAVEQKWAKLKKKRRGRGRKGDEDSDSDDDDEAAATPASKKRPHVCGGTAPPRAQRRPRVESSGGDDAHAAPAPAPAPQAEDAEDKDAEIARLKALLAARAVPGAPLGYAAAPPQQHAPPTAAAMPFAPPPGAPVAQPAAPGAPHYAPYPGFYPPPPPYYGYYAAPPPGYPGYPPPQQSYGSWGGY